MQLRKKSRRLAVVLAGTAVAAALAPAALGIAATGDADAYEPSVTVNAAGVEVQRTPSEDISPTSSATGRYHHPIDNVPYNTYFLNADEKGCATCHGDLAQVLLDMPYGHLDLTNDLGIEFTVDMCFHCHTQSGAATNQMNFGAMIHGIHSKSDVATCDNCHYASNDGEGIQLWDAVKHSQLRGIADISAEDAQEAVEFTYRTDEVIPQSSLFDATWLHFDEVDYEIWDHIVNGDGPDQQMFDEWTITVSGDVAEPVTFSLPDLVANAPVVTKTFKFNCLANPIGGPYIGQCEVTGVPLSWIMDQVEVNDGANVLRVVSSGMQGYGTRRTVDKFLDGDAVIAFEIDGEPLGWLHGYPCMLVSGNVCADADIKQVSDLILETNPDFARTEGKADFSGNFYGKPSVGIMGTYEGQIVQTGEPLTVHGYADGYDERIESIEITLDRGATWMSFPTPETDVDHWVTWDFTFTPGKDAAYCIGVRAVTEAGTVTTVAPYTGRPTDSVPVEKMVVSKGGATESEAN